MIFFDRTTADTALEFYRIVRGITATSSKILFSREFCSMDESFLEKLIEDAIECGLVHLARIHECLLEDSK